MSKSSTCNAPGVIPTYVISLARVRDRRIWMEHELARVGLAATFVAAVDGRDFGPKCATWLANHMTHYRLSPLDAAVVMSHRKVWRIFLASGARHALVLEDDVHFGRDFADLLTVDWSQWSFDVVKLETFKAWTWLSRRRWRLAGRELRRLGSTHFGAAAYIVSVAGARKLLRLTRSAFEPIDHTISGEAVIRRGVVDVLQLWPAAAIQDMFRAASEEAAKLPSVVTPTRGAPAAAFRRGQIALSHRLMREACRIVDQIYDATWRRLRWRRVVVPFE